jgi:iron complex outermembrane recepter protein
LPVGDGRYDVARREAFGVLNLRFGLEAANWKLTAFANNMRDREYLNEVIPAIEFDGSFISPGQRRQVGLEASVKF